jgi:hypothetical protein
MVLPEVKCRCNRLAAFLTNLAAVFASESKLSAPGRQWPVFYQLKTLKVLRAEFAPGKAYEHDVPGLYAQVMLQALRARSAIAKADRIALCHAPHAPNKKESAEQ